MLHCDPDQLALAALSEPLPAPDAAHLASCGQCQAEVASLRRPVEVLRVPSLSAGGEAVPPPPRVWHAIAAATGASAPPPTREVPADLPAPPAEVVPLRPGRHRWVRSRWTAAAAALLVGGAVGAGAVALTRDDGGAVVATTTLDPLAVRDASGRADVRAEDGTRSLEVDLDAPALTDGYYEVWLMEPDAVRMVPVGVVHRGATVLPLPDGLDLAAYSLVDVSVEPLDGDPAHSGLSAARGQLQR